MGIRIGVASLMTLLVLLVGFNFALQCKIIGYTPVWVEQKPNVSTLQKINDTKTCWPLNTSEGRKAELLNVYFLRVGAAAFFIYSDDCKYICLNKEIEKMQKTKEEILRMLKKI